MIQIGDVVVSFDVLREKFLCDLSACKGACCIEGDAGAPVELDEIGKLEEVLPVIWDELSPEARAVLEKQGVVYTDCEGDLVTSIVNNKDCVFTCYDEKGCCYCAIEKAYREGKTDFYKPVSCHLYPIRIGDYGVYKAVNYNRWDVCKAAVLLGRKEDLPVYKFLKEPLIRKFGEDWYAELELVAEEMKKQIGCVFPKDEEETMDVKGRCLLTGLPKVVTVSSTEMMDAFEEPVERIMEAIHSVLERTPPELVADVSTNGIIMTGGGSLVYGFDKLVTARTGIHTTVADDAISCVVLGTGKSLDSLNAMQDGTMNLSRRKQMT